MSKIFKRNIYSPGNVHLRTIVDENTGKEQESRRIEGYAILFNSPSVSFGADRTEDIREVIAPEAVTRELLDNSDIIMTMYHDNQIILARSKRGEGTLSYEIDEKGVKFSFEAPHTNDGKTAIELVKRGDIDGCSFAFSAEYSDKEAVSREMTTDEDGVRHTLYTVRQIGGLYDFTLTPEPAYPATSVEARDLSSVIDEDVEQEDAEQEDERKEDYDEEEIRKMREEADKDIDNP